MDKYCEDCVHNEVCQYGAYCPSGHCNDKETLDDIMSRGEGMNDVFAIQVNIPEDAKQKLIEILQKEPSKLVVDYNPCFKEMPINQEENCNIICDFLRDITGIDIRKGKKHQGEWIPVSERLPKQGNQSYLVTVDYGNGVVCSCQRFFFNDDIGWNDDCVIAWQPLPEPYKKDGVE